MVAFRAQAANRSHYNIQSPAAVAQLLEHLLNNLEVTGSTLMCDRTFVTWYLPTSAYAVGAEFSYLGFGNGGHFQYSTALAQRDHLLN